METIRGKIRGIRFYNETNGYVIASATSKGVKGYFSLMGTFMAAKVSMEFEAQGEWHEDAKYGLEFKANVITEVLPDTNEGIVQYLASGFITGIGPATAKKIVDKFGGKTFDVIEKNPERLLEVKGISPKKLKVMIEKLEDHKKMRETMVFLKAYGISDNLAGKIYAKYHDGTIKVIKEDPYRLADDIDGVGFKKSDEIAIKLGFDMYGDRRISMGINYVLKEGMADKDTYIPEKELIKRASSPDYLNVHDVLVKEQIGKMTENGDLINDDGKVYLKTAFNLESMVANMIASKGVSDMFDKPLSMSDIDTNGVDYSDEQLGAIELALKSRMTVITGGPGVGKTTILKGLLSIFNKHSYKVLLAAPTGRAAKRMSESTGMESKTIHRLLEWQEGVFKRNEHNKLNGDVLILDECSMINLQLMANILKAVPMRMKLIMVGDVDQLPSIGCGTVLKDIIDSGVISVAKLTKIYRQGNESKIILNAHAINDGRMPDLTNPEGTDFWYFRVSTPERIKEQVIRLVTDAIPNKFGIPKKDIQVLSPMRRPTDMIGSTQLNKDLQEMINPKGESMSNSYYNFKKGDRVMQNKNNYDLGVYNGDIGVVVYLSKEEGVLLVRFFGSDKDTEYDKDNLDQLELAYATTVHKSQGSEYSAVVIVADRSQYIMLQKQLFYTAVTRAKKLCVLVGNDEAVRTMVTTKPKDRRHSWLSQRIIDAAEKIKDKEIKFE